jgi:hypothetical protein
MAVGYYVDSGGNDKPFAATWSGTSFVVAPPSVPTGSSSGSLDGVSCQAANRCIAVGAAGETLAERWDGAAWTIESTPNVGDLFSASCVSLGYCEAVGSGGDNGWLAMQRTESPPPGGTPAPPTGAPTLSALRISPRRFVLTGRRVHGGCVTATEANSHDLRCKRPVKLRVSYQLSTSAQVSLTIARLLPGRRVNGRCVSSTQENRRHHRCTRIVPVSGTLTIHGHTGSNSFSFNGRIGGHRLGPGGYRLTAIATASGQAGSLASITFAIYSV